MPIVWPLLFCITSLSAWSSVLMEVPSVGIVRTLANALEQFEDIRCTKHEGCRESINQKKTEGTRQTPNNFQVTYFCGCGKSCLVVCEACAVLSPHEAIVYEASANIINSKILTNKKRNHQRNRIEARIHAQYTELLKTSALPVHASPANDDDYMMGNEQDFDDHADVDNNNSWIPRYKLGERVLHKGKLGTISSVDIDQKMYGVTFGSSAGRFSESSLTYYKFNQIIPDNVLQMYNTSKCLPGDPNLSKEKLPVTKVPPKHLNDFDGFRVVNEEGGGPALSDPSFCRKYGVKKAAINNANLNKPGVFGSTVLLRKQLKDYTELGPDKVFEKAVRKTYDFHGDISEDQLAYQMALYKVAEKISVSNWSVLASALKKQEENDISLAVKATTKGIQEHLFKSGLNAASNFIGATKDNVEQGFIDDLLAELHPSNGIRNGSGVAQIGADIRRLVTNVRNATPVASYTMIDKYIAGAPIADIIAIALAQSNFNLNAIVPDTVPSSVNSVYESKEVVDGKNEWMASCIYWNRGGWESFPVEWMSRVLEKAQLYQQNQTQEYAIFEFVHPSDIFAPIDAANDEILWYINFADRSVLITTGDLNTLKSVLCPLIFGVHYRVEGCIVSWIDGARAADVREHTKQLESAVLSICFNGRHVFRHDTVWCFMLALDTRYDRTFFSRYIDEQLKEFNKYGGRVVYSRAMNEPIVLSLRYIAGAYDRPERMLQSGTTSGQPSSRYGRVEGLLYDVNDQRCTLAMINSNFHIDQMLLNYPHLFKRMDIPVAIAHCKRAFMSSVSAEKLYSYAKIQQEVQPYGPNKKAMLALYNATVECKFFHVCGHAMLNTNFISSQIPKHLERWIHPRKSHKQRNGFNQK